MKSLRFWVWVFMAIAILGVFMALGRFYREHNPELPYKTAQKQSKDPMKVVRHQIVNGKDLWIPVPYFMHFAQPDGVTKDVLLIVMYPDFSPITENYTKLWEEGKWWNNVRILLSDPTGRKKIEEMYQSKTKVYEATDYVGLKYTLHHYSQPVGIKNHRGELWLEGSSTNPESLIDCGKEGSGTPNPQCSLYLEESGFQYKISFDKDLLSDWKEIKSKSRRLIQGFMRNSAPATSSQGK